MSAAVNTSLVAHEVTTILKEKLADSNKKFDVASRILHDALIICDPEGKILFANPIAETIFGAKLANINFKEMLCPNKREDDLWTLLTASPPVPGLCGTGKCYNLDLKAEKLMWSDDTWSIFIVVRDPFHKAITPIYENDCRYPDIT